MSKIIMGIQLKDRQGAAGEVQDVLTKFGCSIKTRLGVHSADEVSCSAQGIIILEFIEGVDDQIKELEKELSKISNVVVKKMEF